MLVTFLKIYTHAHDSQFYIVTEINKKLKDIKDLENYIAHCRDALLMISKCYFVSLENVIEKLDANKIKYNFSRTQLKRIEDRVLPVLVLRCLKPVFILNG